MRTSLKFFLPLINLTVYQGFPALTLLAFWIGWFWVLEASPVYFRMFGSIPGLDSPDARSTPSCNGQNCLYTMVTSPSMSKLPPSETRWCIYDYIGAGARSEFQTVSPKYLYWYFIEVLILSCMVVYLQQSCPTLCDPMDCSPSGSSVHGISQARILEWVAIPFCRESSWPRNWTLHFLHWQVDSLPPGKAFHYWS